MTDADVARGRAAGAATRLRLPMVLRLALTELRAGLGGFYVFIACIALGVGVITAVGSLGDALQAGFADQGRTILGGDVTLSRMHQRASEAERRWLEQTGILSETATMQAMARRADGSEQALVELKAVDGRYPLVGAVRLADGGGLGEALAGGGVAVEPILLERLSLKPGDPLAIGDAVLPVTAIVEKEPDAIADRMTFGPRIFISHEAMQRTGLVQPGTLIRWRYALAGKDGVLSGEQLEAFRGELAAGLPQAGFIGRDRRDPAPQVTRTVERLRQFLTLIGLTALIVGGVGVANAVATYMDRRRKVVATLKSLGATSGVVFRVFLAQVMLIAAIGVVIGLAVGWLVPTLLGQVYAGALPVETRVTLNPASLAMAAAYGFLVALVFTLWPLGRAERVSPAVLFREEVQSAQVWPRWWVLAAITVTLATIVALAVLGSDSRRIALVLCGSVAVVLSAFVGLGQLIMWLARRLPRPRRPELRLAVGNIAAPDGLARSVIVSLGLGLSLLVAVALADASLVRELTTRMPANGPAYFVLDIAKADLERFKALVGRVIEGAEIRAAPMLRGRMVRVKDVPVEGMKVPPEAQWVLNGDRGLTYANEVPEGSTVTAGEWWPADYDGPPLVSFEADLAKGLGLGVGDTVTVNVLGRNVTARIANLREVKWESLAINFVMVFSPNTLARAPHNILATVTLPKDTPLAAEAEIARVVGRELTSVTAIRVKDAINQFSAVFAKIMNAVRIAGSVTLVAGALVLAGALLTAQRRRVEQAVILKTLGATRPRLLMAHLAEYLILAASTGLFAVVLGSAAAWVTLTQVLDVEFAFSWTAVLAALGLASGLVVLFGGIGTYRVLTVRPVPVLRGQ